MVIQNQRSQINVFSILIQIVGSFSIWRSILLLLFPLVFFCSLYSVVAKHTPNLIYSEHILSLFFYMSTVILLISHMQISAPFLLGKTHDPAFKWTIYGFSALFEREAITASSVSFDYCGYKWYAL